MQTTGQAECKWVVKSMQLRNQRPMPDWAHVHAELRRPGVTLALLWQEYRLTHLQGFQYSWF
ncbi:hypothetical protein, partial [Pseudomonas gessardii]|uniref:hypothetical protein n=1 Tax=Pseudomonas gessardii TaxID=78544 RepID=UPI001032A349